MKYLIAFNESRKEFKPYKVIILFEYNYPYKKIPKYYEFSEEDKMIEFLNFIYDLREFIPDSGFGNVGYFEDHIDINHLNTINKKFNNKFDNFIPIEENVLPNITSMHVEIDELPLNIIWGKALNKTKKINLPKIGDKFYLNTGEINGKTLGMEVFGGEEHHYYDYSDLDYMDDDFEKDEYGDSKEYSKLFGYVSDCKVGNNNTYTHDDWKVVGDKEVKVSSFKGYNDYTSLSYVLLLRFVDGFIVTEEHGYDPNFESKYHRPKFGTNDFYFVD